MSGDGSRRNQRLYRAVNARIREVGRPPGRAALEFLCECGRTDGTATVALTPAQYDTLVSAGESVLVATEHADAVAGRRVVAQNGRALPRRRARLAGRRERGFGWVEPRYPRPVQAPSPFRRGNEAIARAAARTEAEGRIDFICECADEDCLAAVPLTLEGYRRARDGGGHPLTVPGHDASVGERRPR